MLLPQVGEKKTQRQGDDERGPKEKIWELETMGTREDLTIVECQEAIPALYVEVRVILHCS
jgi:hypothetical protein